ncbi:MAG: DUF3810 domain-containing protein [Sediminibacterium sp.]
MASTLRILSRWAPFSIGDLLYAILFIWLIVRVIRWINRLIRREYSWQLFGISLVKLASALLLVYIVFKSLWGLNYDRLGIAYQLGLSRDSYTKADVTNLTDELIGKLNQCRRDIQDSLLPSPSMEAIYKKADSAYQDASIDYAFLHYNNRSVKASLFTPIADYIGFTGYYDPFTGEAQLRTDIPRILTPYIACHEMAHQLGYASESEANFVGYLAAATSKDVYFRYSVYLELFSYAQGEEIALYGKENNFKSFKALLQHNRQSLDTLVKKDRRDIREFFSKRKNNLSPAISSLYDQYLKLNKQSEGINSYNEVIGWLIAYEKKYGKL